MAKLIVEGGWTGDSGLHGPPARPGVRRDPVMLSRCFYFTKIWNMV